MPPATSARNGSGQPIPRARRHTLESPGTRSFWLGSAKTHGRAATGEQRIGDAPPGTRSMPGYRATERKRRGPSARVGYLLIATMAAISGTPTG